MNHLIPDLHAFALTSNTLSAKEAGNNVLESWDMSANSLQTEHYGFVCFIATHSPYLARLLAMHHDVFVQFCDGKTDLFCNILIDDIYNTQTKEQKADAARHYIRICKQRLSLIIALADISGVWTLTQVITMLSRFAEASTQFALEQIYRTSVPSHVVMQDEVASRSSGISILGMGKLGGHELNYSSDIDLIVLYDPEKLDFLSQPARGRFAVRIIQQLASFLQDRDADGYVFRVDLRLRPDPASTGLAVSLDTAIRYYENVGQNWERAAMIKARVIAGDINTGTYFLETIQPFIWRNHLDFAAIDDILSIKRQMQAHEEPDITLPDHNIKTGYGGIREIEFLAQIYQLIWGGRLTELRVQSTCVVLEALAGQGLISQEANKDLQTAYRLFRIVEHRLQMRQDQQTHSLPNNEAAFDDLSTFCGFDSTEQFTHTVMTHLQRVHEYFTSSFKDSVPLGHQGKLVFTGVDHDTDTLHTLEVMGFIDSEFISRSIQQWHKGSKRCTRTKRARELITELVPTLLDALAQTADPDSAFKRFDAFLDALPSGVQLFSLFNSNKALVTLLSNIVGNAPVLAATLARYPQMLDLVVERHGAQVTKSRFTLEQDLTNWLTLARNEEELYHYFCMFKLEKEFTIGVQLLERSISPKAASRYLSKLADTMIAKAVSLVQQQLNDKYNVTPTLEFAIIALGKLGSESLMIGSDLDVMCIYDMQHDMPEDASISLNQYYTRLTARVIHLLSYPTKNGPLYEMDTQLRPYGTQGAVAVKLESFSTYYKSSAWLVENLALVQGRIVTSSTAIYTPLQDALSSAIIVQANYNDIINNVLEVRRKISEQYYSSNPWNIKYVWGGLMDIQWILKTLLAKYAKEHPLPNPIYDTEKQISWLYDVGAVDKRQSAMLRSSHTLFHDTLSYLRLCHTTMADDDQMTEGFRALLTSVTRARSFEQLRQKLLRAESQIYQMFQNLEYL